MDSSQRGSDPAKGGSTALPATSEKSTHYSPTRTRSSLSFQAPDRSESQRNGSFPELRSSVSPANDVQESEKVRITQSPPSQSSVHLDGEDDEPAEPQVFERSKSPAMMQRNKGAVYGKVGDEGIGRMHNFSLYETSTRFYLIGRDVMDRHFRVMKIDREAPRGHLSVFEDDIVYDRKEINQLLNAIESGNKGSGGFKLKCVTWGLLGFIRFTEAYYMLLVTKRRQVAMLGGHFIYEVNGTELVPLTTNSNPRFQRERNPEESRFLSIFNTLDLSKTFYFSYSYNITRTLQYNIARERNALSQGVHLGGHDFNDMFIWNHYLLEPARTVLKSTFDWCLPIIHGSVQQSCIDVFGRQVYVTVIARRSRVFAGARYLKRGANDLGFVANDVETEQIVSELLTTSFHAPGPRLYSNPTYTSYVQHRGSIPLYWTQDNTGVTPKPDIDLNLIDPFFSAAALHFDNLFERYGCPIFVLNLIKQRERTPRETKLLREFQNALNYLNQSLPPGKKILYKAFDMSRASKTRGLDVIGQLEIIAEEILQKTGFFHNGEVDFDQPRVQNGVARTNCIDCLDRTNAAQFVIGKRALGHQLQALGVIKGSTVEYDTDAVNKLTEMFHVHGDTIAMQYGGSHLVNTMATYRKLNHWQGHSRDMVETFKRYYHNSFLDSQRQEAYNLFLGNYIFTQGQPMLWDLQTDYYLHHSDPRSWSGKEKRSYTQWYTPSFLKPRTIAPQAQFTARVPGKDVSAFDDYWLEYYRPHKVTTLKITYSFKLQDRTKYLEKLAQGENYDLSPFRPRKSPIDSDYPEKRPVRKGVTIVDPLSDADSSVYSSVVESQDYPRHLSISSETAAAKQSILRDPHFETTPLQGTSTTNSGNLPSPEKQVDKGLMTQWTLQQFYHNSLNPSVTSSESSEYERYIAHPQNLPLVVSTEAPDYTAYPEFFEYVGSILGTESGDSATGDISDEDLADYTEYLAVKEDPLTVTEEDGTTKRYKAYRQWLRGKSLFKLSKVDPEYRA